MEDEFVEQKNFDKSDIDEAISDIEYYFFYIPCFVGLGLVCCFWLVLFYCELAGIGML